jgi:Family of unknown function (DUF5681)
MRKKGSPGHDNYVVGRGRPPLLTRWKPGQSGNPKGRPKGAKNIMTCFRQELNRKIDIRTGERVRRVTAREAIAMTITNRALKGDPKLLPVIMAIDRDVSALEAHEKRKRSIVGMTPQEAMEAYRRSLRGEDDDEE